jgi:hypothetical protein
MVVALCEVVANLPVRHWPFVNGLQPVADDATARLALSLQPRVDLGAHRVTAYGAAAGVVRLSERGERRLGFRQYFDSRSVPHTQHAASPFHCTWHDTQNRVGPWSCGSGTASYGRT